MARKMKSAVSLVLILFLVVLAGHETSWGQGKRLKISTSLDAQNMDPAQLNYSTDRAITQQILQGLVSFDYRAKPPFPIVPVLAKSYMVSKDAKTITFELRRGVQFHGGFGELTSEDVAFSLLRHLDPKVASRAKGQLQDIDRVEPVDPYTVRVHLKNPTAFSFLQVISYQEASFILSKKAVAQLGEKISHHPIGTGPFMFDRWNPGEKIVIKKFPQYWGTPAKIDEVEFVVIPEDIISLGVLGKGDLDVVPITDPAAFERAKGIKGTYIQTTSASPQLYQLMINHKMKPMDDVRVRKALAHALDIKSLCTRLGPIAMPWESPFEPSVFSGTNEFWKYEYSIDKAKKLLAEAGFPNGFELKLIYKRQDLFEPIALEAANYWKKIVDVKLELVEGGVFVQTINKYNHHVVHWSTSRFSPFQFAERYWSKSSQPYFQYSNPRVDDLLMKANTAVTEEEALKLWREFQRMIVDDVVQVGVCIQVPQIAVRNHVRGIVIMTSYLFMLDYAYME